MKEKKKKKKKLLKSFILLSTYFGRLRVSDGSILRQFCLKLKTSEFFASNENSTSSTKCKAIFCSYEHNWS